jgi:uncharacterized protein (TIGR02231 family)
VVNTTNGVAVQSVTFQNNYLTTDNVSPRVKELQDSIVLVNAQRAPINNKIATLNEQVTILQSNRKVNGDNSGLSVAELVKLLDVVNTRMENYLNDKNKQEALLKKIDERLVRLNQQLADEQQKGYQPGGLLAVKFYAKEATASNITITYVVPNAGWSPVYDIIADDAKGPVTLYYKANIYQNSGVKWNNVHLTLSTGNPQEGMQPPVLTPWYLAFYTPQQVNVTYRKALVNTPSAAMAYSSAEAPAFEDAGAQASMSNYVQVDNSGINTEFDIDIPYTIPADGQQHLVAVKRYEVPATYVSFASPKLDKDAFQEAKITGWEDLNLLPGTTNIFYEGSFVGNGSIDPRSIQDTMTVSLGRDKKIVVRRELDKQYRSVKMIGSNVREQTAYNITVRNTRKEAVTIEVNDQQPVSNDKEIVIEDRETDGAEFDEATGLMKWKFTLKPNETRKLKFSYTLKYPKGKTIANK